METNSLAFNKGGEAFQSGLLDAPTLKRLRARAYRVVQESSLFHIRDNAKH